MNLFRDINRGVQKLNNFMSSNTQQSQGNRTNDYLTELIRSCTYSDDVKFIIEKSVRQLLHVYPQFIADAIEFVQHNQRKRFVELKGQINVDYKGNVPLYIMYPFNFPKHPPFLRIVNRNPQTLLTIPYYRGLQSKSDSKSYLLNDCLQEVKGWKSNSSVASIMIEVNDLVRNNYPFQASNQYQNQYNSQNQWNSQPFGNNYPQQMQKQNSWGQQQPKQPPIPFKPNANIAQTANKAKNLVTSQKEKLNKLSKSHIALLPVLQQLETSRVAQEAESNILRMQTQKMMVFVEQSGDMELISFADLVTPEDRASQEMLNLNCSLKAREDCIHLLQSKFNDEEISLQDFMKNIRKLQEARFEERYILNKHLQQFSRIRNL